MLPSGLTKPALNLTTGTRKTAANSTDARTDHDVACPDSPGSVCSRMVTLSIDDPRDLDSADDKGPHGAMRPRPQSRAQFNNTRPVEHDLSRALHDAELWRFAKKHLYSNLGYRSSAQMEADVVRMKNEAQYAQAASGNAPRKSRRTQSKN